MKAAVLLAVAAVAAGAFAGGSHRLWYGQPAEDSLTGWERQSLPLGCGHFGVSVSTRPTGASVSFVPSTVFLISIFFSPFKF